MRVLIADGESRVRRALKVVLERQPEVEAVFEAKNVSELMSAVTERTVDLLILDWELSGDSGGAALSKVRDIHPDIRVIAVSGRRSTQMLALDSGADEFVCKCDSGQRLLDAIAKCREKDMESVQ